MTDIPKMLAEIVRAEGGYVNNPADKGGPTKFGITQATLSSYLGRAVSIEEVKNLPVELAQEIYATKYYHAPRIDTLPDPIQPNVLDAAVMSGPRQAIKMLQRVINYAGVAVCDVDGALGPQTRSAVGETFKAMGGFLNNAYVDERLSFYAAIVANNPTQAIFARGWEKRAERFRVEV